MTRAAWFAVDVALVAAAVAAGWLAVNAPSLVRPPLEPTGRIETPRETPPLPPAPFRPRATADADGLARRSVFAAPGAAGRLDGSVAAPGEPPAAVGVSVTPSAPFGSDPRQTPERFWATPGAEISVAIAPPRPRHGQFFGGHQIPDEIRRSGPDGEGPVAEGLGPARAFRPEPNPRRRSVDDAPPAIVQGGDGDEGVAAAATQQADPASVEDDGLILLGVLVGRGADRALVRTPDGSAVRVSQGDEVAGWRVATISDDQIQLRRATQTRILRMPTEAQ